MDQVSTSFNNMTVNESCSPSKSPFVLKFPLGENARYEVCRTNKPLLISRRASHHIMPAAPPPPPPLIEDASTQMQFFLEEDDTSSLLFNEESYITPVMQTNRKMYYTGPTRTPHMPCLSEVVHYPHKEGRNDFDMLEFRDAEASAARTAVVGPRLMFRRANRAKQTRPELVGL